MELNRTGKFPKMECPELELPEKDRCSLPEMEYAGKEHLSLDALCLKWNMLEK